MSYEERDNGTHAVMCDVQGCGHEMLAPTKEDAFGDANLAGWAEAGDDQAGKPQHACRDCSDGTNPMQTALQQALGTATPHVMAPAQVRQGDPVYAEDGSQVGTYAEDGDQGEAVPINIDLPEPPKPGEGASDAYAAMMDGTDEDDDANPAYRSAVAPAGNRTAGYYPAMVDDEDPGGAGGEGESGGSVRRADSGIAATDCTDGGQEAEETQGRPGGFQIEFDDNDDNPFDGWDPYSDD